MAWAKGESGNPGGRPKGMKEVQEAARKHTADAIKTLADIAKDVEMSAGARVSAAEALLDRGWGKAPQTLEIEGINQLPEHVIDALLAAFDVIEAEGLGGGGPTAGNGSAAPIKADTSH